jgi:hypothetical protein
MKKITFRCNHYRAPLHTHNPAIDPSDHCKGKTIRSECMAHVNINRITGTDIWRITLANWFHNHPCDISPGGVAARPPTPAMKEVIFKYAERGQFSRDQVKTILQDKFPQNSLESRQITNVMNQARREACDVIKELGGDVASILSSLQGMNDAGEGWSYKIRLDETQRVVGIWWQSAIQAQLTRRFYDILINDNAANRNIYNYPLNIGIVIDNYCKSRNAWYAVQAMEDNETHAWVLKCHLNSAQKPPEVVATDRQASLISTVPTVLPLSQHIYCLYHLNGNVAQHVRPALGAAFEQFTVDFWGCYRAESPEAFDALWMQLTSTYTQVQEYLNAELYECRAKWAWALVGQVFTAGVRTNGRVKSENRVNKTLGGPKTTLLELFHWLNERTESQSVQEMTHVREVRGFSLPIGKD